MAEPRQIRYDVDRVALETVREILRGPNRDAVAALRFLNTYLDSTDSSSGAPASTAPAHAVSCSGVGGPKSRDLKAASEPGAPVVPAPTSPVEGDAAAPGLCVSGAPDEDHTPSMTRRLTPVEGPDICGYVSDILTNHVCIRGAHPGNPRGHVYVAFDGSDVPDRHTATEDQAEAAR